MLLKLPDHIQVKKEKKTPPTGAKRSTPKTPRAKAVVYENISELDARLKQLFADERVSIIYTEEQLEAFLSLSNEFGLDTETTGLDPFKNTVVGFSIGTTQESAYIPLRHKVGRNYVGKTDFTSLFKGKRLYGFNYNFDGRMLAVNQGWLPQIVWDGYIACRTMNHNEEASLKAQYVKHIDPGAQFYTFRSLFKNTFDTYDPELVAAYAAVDARKHIALGKWQEQVLLDKCPEMYKRLVQLEFPLLHHIIRSELRGVLIDIDYAKGLAAQYNKRLEAARKVIADQTHEGFNPASPKQLAKLLYDDLKLPMVEGRKTGEEILKRLNHPICKAVLELRGLQKLLSTYIEKMPADADPHTVTRFIDGETVITTDPTRKAVHCEFNQVGADTGRMSSSNPNLQNIPARKVHGIREMFVARPGHCFVDVDYPQQEPRILAYLANDAVLIDVYRSGKDFYGYMASLCYGYPYEECLKGKPHQKERDQMKSIVLGLLYDMSVYTLAKDLDITVDKAKWLYAKFLEVCPAVAKFREESIAFAKKNGYVKTILGWRRRFTALGKQDFKAVTRKPDVDLFYLQQICTTAKNIQRSRKALEQLQEDCAKEGITLLDLRGQQIAELRQVVNSRVQGSAADMTKLAALAIYENEEIKQLGAEIVLFVHDEIMLEAPKQHAKRVGEIAAHIMAEVAEEITGNLIPFECEPEIMERWTK